METARRAQAAPVESLGREWGRDPGPRRSDAPAPGDFEMPAAAVKTGAVNRFHRNEDEDPVRGRTGRLDGKWLGPFRGQVPDGGGPSGHVSGPLRPRGNPGGRFKRSPGLTVE